MTLLAPFKIRLAISSLDIMHFIKQLSLLLGAAIPLVAAIETIEKSTKKLTLKQFMNEIKADILTGNALHECFTKQSKHIDHLTCHLVKLGEHTGRLAQMLTFIADYQEKSRQIKSKITQALFYPCMTLSIALIIVIGMLLFVIPRFVDLFANSNIALPWLTRFIFYCSLCIKQILYGLLFCLLLASLILLHTDYRRRCKAYCQTYGTRLPLIKSCWHTIILMRFTRQLSLTLNAGLPLAEALKLINSSYRSPEFVMQIAKLRSKISSGLQLHEAMTTSTYFPPLLVQMVKIGEASGTLETMLMHIADLYETESQQFLNRCQALLEPLIMLILGVLIGGIVIGMYLPIFRLGNTL